VIGGASKRRFGSLGTDYKWPRQVGGGDGWTCRGFWELSILPLFEEANSASVAVYWPKGQFALGKAQNKP